MLVIEDDATIRQTVRDLIQLEGYAVVTAADGAAGLALAAERRPCVILLDMRMPRVDGWEFVRRYRARTPTPAPIVVMTAAVSARQSAADVGADGVLAKPFDADDLMAVLDRWCR